MWEDAILLAHALATVFMAGLVWFVQVVHYPLFARVGASSFVAYELEHTRRTSRVVGPPMLVEAATAALLVLRPPPDVAPAAILLGAALLAVVWASTLLLQMPRHAALCRGFDSRSIRFLVQSNWLRTAAWSVRAPLALYMLAHAGP